VPGKICKGYRQDRFPGIQGAAHACHCSQAVAFKEAMSREFIDYQKQIVKNAKKIADELIIRGND